MPFGGLKYETSIRQIQLVIASMRERIRGSGQGVKVETSLIRHTSSRLSRTVDSKVSARIPRKSIESTDSSKSPLESIWSCSLWVASAAGLRSLQIVSALRRSLLFFSLEDCEMVCQYSASDAISNITKKSKHIKSGNN